MNFEEICSRCHVRSAIYHPKDPGKRKFWKNHTIPLSERVPENMQFWDGWEEYDPRDDDDGSLFMMND